MSSDTQGVYVKTQTLEKELYTWQLRVKELEHKEQTYFQEIQTLERHIDKLTYQLEQAHIALRAT